MSESIGAAADELRRIADTVPSAEVAELGDTIDRVRDQLGELVGTEHELTEHAGQLATAIASVFRDLVALRQTLCATADHHLGSSSPTSPSTPSTHSAAPAASPPPVRAADGSEYPAAAAWAVPELPARVQGKRDKTVGRIKINDRALPVPVESGMDTWSGHAGERMRALGIPEYLRSHVEMKLAALMINTGAQHGEAVINHAPCGSEPSARGGCHASLEQFIPRGHSLTVHGTTAQGRAFTSTYRGRA